MSSFISALRQEFEVVRARTADIIERQVSFAWLEHWLEEGQISHDQIGTTQEEFEKLRTQYLDENRLFLLPPVNNYIM